MNQAKGVKNICSRGHLFYKSSDCPVCPKCWSGYYREKNGADFPDKLAAPVLRALLNEGIFNLKALSNYSEKEILEFHGIGKTSIPLLKESLEKKGLTFKTK